MPVPLSILVFIGLAVWVARLAGARVYLDFRERWIGYYRRDEHNYVCLLPTVVVRWPRRDKIRGRRRA
jgi:hypothetical protein